VRYRHKHKPSLWLSLAVGAVMLALYLAGLLAGFEARAYDAFVLLRTEASVAENVRIVLIDDSSLEALGPWPWPRGRHAELLRRAAEVGPPRAVVFDLLFLNTPGKEEEDAELARALREAGNAFLAMYFEREPGQPLEVGEHGVLMTQVRKPSRALAQAAKGMGPVNVFPDRDGVVRSAPVAIDYNGRPYPSLAVQVASFAAGEKWDPLQVRLGDHAQLGRLRIPVDHAGEMLIHFAGPYGSVRWESYVDVLRGRIPRGWLKDKVVIVGFSAAGMADSHATPVSPAMPGVEINAHIVNTILQGEYLRKARWHVPIILILGAAIVLGFGVANLPPARCFLMAVLLSLAFLLGGIYSLNSRGVWIPVVTPILTVGVTLLACMVDAFRRAEKDEVELESSLSTLAMAARMLGASTSRKALLTALRDEIRDVVQARRSDIFLLDEDGQRLSLVSATGEVSPSAVSFATGEGLAGRVAAEGKALVLNPPLDRVSPVDAGRVSDILGFEPGALLLVPLKHHDRLLGVVQVARRRDETPFAERDAALLEALAFEAAVALENAELYEKLEGRVELANRELVRAYRELAAEKDRVETLLQNMADAVIMNAPDGRALYLNPAGQALFGIKGSDAVGAELSVFQLGGLSELVAEAQEQASATAQLTLEKPERRVLSATAKQIKGPDGTPIGTVTVLTDVTVLQELSEMKTELVRHVSHELRGPLTPIQGFAQMLLQQQSGFDPETREFLQIISHQSIRLQRLVEGLLDAARLEAGRGIELNIEPTALRPVVDRVIALEKLGTETHNFAVSIPDDLPLLAADESRLEQVIINLVHNAVKYSPDGGEISVTARTDGPVVEISVSDQGLGMTQQEVEQLFQPFYRLGRDSEKRIKGAGLGLYLTKQLVELHGGRVRAESEGSGRGSSFHFTIPVAGGKTTESGAEND